MGLFYARSPAFMPLLTALHHCNVCDRDLPRSDFSRNCAYASGLQNRCKTCMRAYRKGHYKANADQLKAKARLQRATNGEAPPPLLAGLLSSTPCLECNTTQVARHFKLREGPRSFNLKQADQIGVTHARLLEELKKYDVVCSSCSPPRREYTLGYHRMSKKLVKELDKSFAPKKPRKRKTPRNRGV